MTCDNDYLIRPISFMATLERNPSPRPLRNSKEPRLRINIEIDNISINLEKSYFKFIAKFVESFNIYKNLVNLAVRKHSQNCWYYIKSAIQKRLRWEEFKKWASDVVIYSRFKIEVFNSRINQTSSLKKSENVKRIEKEWPFKRLVTLNRAIFEKFVNTPGYRIYLVKMRGQNQQKIKHLNYGYLSWPLNIIKDYYLNKVL